MAKMKVIFDDPELEQAFNILEAKTPLYQTDNRGTALHYAAKLISAEFGRVVPDEED